ncbi:MAG: hypothetical protein HY313_07290 [Acidobacteria bacterium]|nr:hypothetical protein [Acidobacteriota bacterium]
MATDAREWLDYWVSRYPRNKYPSINHLIRLGTSGPLSSADFEWIGKWKDGALNGDKWKPNVAMVAYEIWTLASSVLPGMRISDEQAAAGFLTEWIWKTYKDTYRNGSVRKKKFGLSRASTLLHVISGGMFPILDSNVRTAFKRLTGSPLGKTTWIGTSLLIDRYSNRSWMLAEKRTYEG